MIRLNSMTMALGAVLDAGASSAQLQCAVSFYDVPSAHKGDNSEYRGATVTAVTDDTTDVVICAAPMVAGTVRDIDYLSVFNSDDAAATVIVKIDDDGTETILVQRELAVGESLCYEHRRGWYKF